MKPAGAQYFSHGSWFKVNRNNKVLRWVNDDWILSSMTLTEIRHKTGRIVTDRVQAASVRRESRKHLETKKCKGIHGCGKVKLVAEFMKQNMIYYFSHCRDCEKVRQKNYQKTYRRAA
jgi:hypothetical protein